MICQYVSRFGERVSGVRFLFVNATDVRQAIVELEQQMEREGESIERIISITA